MARKQTHEPAVSRTSPASPSSSAPAAGDAMLRFTPAGLVRGIVFHLLDDGIASAVTDDSARRTLARLERRNACPCVRRSVWAAMANADRLGWLLTQSRTTTFLCGGEVALMEARE